MGDRRATVGDQVMARTHRGWTVGVAICALGALGACTEASLQPQPPDIPPDLDNLLRIKGDFCTEPSADVTFPVKVLYLVDQSASLQCTDSTNRRFIALNNSVGELSQLPNTEFAFVGFSSWSREVAFTRDEAEISGFLDPASGLGPATDYQGALSVAMRMIEGDILENFGPMAARTKYVVIFVSDGIPAPRCNAGCEDTVTDCTDGEDNDGDGRIDGADPDCIDIDDNALHPDNIYGVCNTTEEVPEDVYVDYSGICPEYNQTPQIMSRVQDLLQLKETYNVGDITLHTVLLFSPQEVVEAICTGQASQLLGSDRQQATALMRAMAASGNGTFRDVNVAGGDENFLHFDVSSLKAEQTLNGMLVRNQHGRLTPDGLMTDVDTDGLIDDRETLLKTDREVPDTDGDGYSDLFEVALADQGFDPLDPTAPARPCEGLATEDSDGDGLKTCEESVLKTSQFQADSDGDNVTDWTELVLGTDPVVNDALTDLDFDGVLNYDEIRGGTNPLVPDGDDYRVNRTIYGLDDLGQSDTGDEEIRHCYGFNISRVQLVKTPDPRNPGLNRLYLYTFEGATRISGVPGEVRVACFEANYQGGRVKSPASGEIDVTQAGIEQVAEVLQNKVDKVAECRYFHPDPLADPKEDELCSTTLDCARGAVCIEGGCRRSPNRSGIVTMMQECMGDKIEVAGRLYPQTDFTDPAPVGLLARHLEEGRLIPKRWDASATDFLEGLPLNSYDIFVPIADFDPEVHCFRPWEFELIGELFDTLATTCNQCVASRAAEAPPSE